MQEIELKFLIPEVRLKGLMRQVNIKSSQVTQMKAHYYDTAEHVLATHGIGLRIRQEGDHWVQTIKAGGDGIAARLEHNTRLSHAQVQAMVATNNLIPDLSLYADTPIEPALATFNLKKIALKLRCQYVTDIQRTTRIIEDDDSSVEVAYDVGDIINGNNEDARSAVQEIEFELIRGEVGYLFAVVKVWCKRYKLCLSTVTKAERGGLLINAQDYSLAVKADLTSLNIDDTISMPAFIRAAVQNCLLQILPNNSAIVAGSTDNDHILQLGIGIRRLHTALKTCKKFSAQLNSEWLLTLKQTLTQLDSYLEIIHLQSHIEPKLRRLGAPSVDWSAPIDTIKTIDNIKNIDTIKNIKITAINAVSANDFQLMLLELIEFTMSVSDTEPNRDKLAVKKLTKIVSKQYSKLLKAEDKVAKLNKTYADNSSNVNDNFENNEASQFAEALYHAQRKAHFQLERLQYLSEFMGLLYKNKKSKRWLKRVTKANQSLSIYLDNVQSQQYYQRKSLIDTNALYGAGWCAATYEHNNTSYQKHLKKLKSCTKFW